MNWIKLPIAWQVGSSSMLLASISIHGILLAIPLADKPETPKPEILAAVPITALPAEPTIESATELPESESMGLAPPQPGKPSIQESTPEEPSVEASEPLFDRFPPLNRSSFPERLTSFPRQPENLVEPEKPIEEIETVEDTEEAITEVEETPESVETDSLPTEETQVENQNEEIIPENTVESPPSIDPRKKIRLTSTTPSSTSEDSGEAEEIDRTFSQGNESVEDLFSSLGRDEKGEVYTGETDIMKLLQPLEFFLPKISNLVKFLFEQNTSTLKPEIDKNQSVFITSSTKSTESTESTESKIDTKKLYEYYITPLEKKGFKIEEQPDLPNLEGKVYRVEKTEFVRYIQLYETDGLEGQLLAGVVVWTKLPGQ